MTDKMNPAATEISEDDLEGVVGGADFMKGFSSPAKPTKSSKGASGPTKPSAGSGKHSAVGVGGGFMPEPELVIEPDPLPTKPLKGGGKIKG